MHYHTQEDLVSGLQAKEYLKSKAVIDVMQKLDRSQFVTPGDFHRAYLDQPLDIGFSVTISAPHMHAICLELLVDYIVKSERVLDIGSGSGYMTLAMAMLMPHSGLAVGIESIPELYSLCKARVGEMDIPETLKQRVFWACGDGSLGFPKFAPYDAIHVGAAAEVIPQALLEQLKIGGRLVIPIGPRHGTQKLKVIDRVSDKGFEENVAGLVSYVQLYYPPEK